MAVGDDHPVVHRFLQHRSILSFSPVRLPFSHLINREFLCAAILRKLGMRRWWLFDFSRMGPSTMASKAESCKCGGQCLDTAP
ncbi:hypothetical protein DAI22_11g092600 [Oryza sativa Japonica Group]|nr:hypothetical protein DAI22_11g092600 [Oryza sativa Japonica Group]